MKFSRKTGLFFLFAAIAAVIVYGFMPKPVFVETVEVGRGSMRVLIKEEGRTRVKNRFVVSAPVAGYALRIDLDVGDTLRRGDTVTELEPLRPVSLDPRSRAEAEARVSAAEAALNSAKEKMAAVKAGAAYAEKEFRRIKSLYKDGLVAQGDLDEAETELRRLEASLNSNRFAVEVARYEMEAARTALRYSAAQDGDANMERLKIAAPVDGRVLKIYHESEGVVREGQALIEIGDPGALEIEVDVLSADAIKIRPGTPVVFERWGGEETLEGKVRIVEPAGFTEISALGIEEQRVLVISDIVSPYSKWSKLGDGYRVEAGFIIWEDENILQVPSSALFRYKDGWAVFVVEDKKARVRNVKIGNRNGLSSEILSGLNESEIVITHPDSSIEDGTRIKLY